MNSPLWQRSAAERRPRRSMWRISMRYDTRLGAPDLPEASSAPPAAVRPHWAVIQALLSPWLRCRELTCPHQLAVDGDRTREPDALILVSVETKRPAPAIQVRIGTLTGGSVTANNGLPHPIDALYSMVSWFQAHLNGSLTVPQVSVVSTVASPTPLAFRPYSCASSPCPEAAWTSRHRFELYRVPPRFDHPDA